MKTTNNWTTEDLERYRRLVEQKLGGIEKKKKKREEMNYIVWSGEHVGATVAGITRDSGNRDQTWTLKILSPILLEEPFEIAVESFQGLTDAELLARLLEHDLSPPPEVFEPVLDGMIYSVNRGYLVVEGAAIQSLSSLDSYTLYECLLSKLESLGEAVHIKFEKNDTPGMSGDGYIGFALEDSPEGVKLWEGEWNDDMPVWGCEDISPRLKGIYESRGEAIWEIWELICDYYGICSWGDDEWQFVREDSGGIVGEDSYGNSLRISTKSKELLDEIYDRAPTTD
jgi:hypothetical protein